MIDFKPPKKYRVVGKNGDTYEGYIAPGCIKDEMNMETGEFSRKVIFNLYLDEPHYNNAAAFAFGTCCYVPKVIPITDAMEYIEKIEEIDD